VTTEQQRALTAEAAAATEPPAPRPLLGRPSVQGTLALLAYAIGWMSTIAWPVVSHLRAVRLYQHSQDPNFYLWCLRWWPYALSHGLDPLFTHQIGAPAGYSLAWATTVPPVALAAAPLTVTAGPVVSYNLVFALALPVSAWAAFLLCRRLTGKFWPSLAAGAIFGFSAYETGHALAGQLNLTYGLLLPLLAYLVVVWRDRGLRDWLFVLLAGLIMAAQFYLFLETFAGLTAVLAVSMLLGLALAGQAGRARMLRLTVLTALAYVVAIVLAAPYLALTLSDKEPVPILSTSADLASLVVPRPTRTYGISWLMHAAKLPTPTAQGCYIGIPLLVLVIALAVTSWSSRLVRFLVCLLAVVLLAALGPAVRFEGRQLFELPWHALWNLPMVRNAYPVRLMTFAYLILAVLAALWLAGPGPGRLAGARWLTWIRWALGLLAVGVILANTAALKISPVTSVPAYISSGQYQATLSRDEIVVVASDLGNAGMLWQADSDFYWRLDGGFINQSVHNDYLVPLQIQNLGQFTPANVAIFTAYVRNDHVGAILVDAHHAPSWTKNLSRLLTARRIGGVLVYQTGGCRSCHA
jgi:hypothetical protein